MSPVSTYRQNWRYRQLFWSIIILFLFASFADFAYDDTILSLLLSGTLLLMLRTLAIAAPWPGILRSLIILALGSNLISHLLPNSPWFQFFFILEDTIFSLFLGFTIILLTQQIAQARRVDQDIIAGSICIYLLLGILWFLFYRISFIVSEDNFQNLIGPVENLNFELLYFSFTTLTTLGYGDITPTGTAAMGLTNLEAIVGQLYPAIFIARLMSLYIVDWEEHSDNEK